VIFGCLFAFQCEVNANLQHGKNMATSLHEGPANQLDLLIRAGNGIYFRTRSTGDRLLTRCVFILATACAPPPISVK
jgi:hypothetical protein